MRFQVKDPKKNSSLLLKYREVMKDVAGLLLSRLYFSRPLYEAKLKSLNVLFIPTDSEPSGFMEIDYNRRITKIVILINDSVSINFTRVIMAHELYHLLFAATSPVASMGYNFTDKSYQVNAIIRRNSNGEYGNQLNEQVTNFLAFETIKSNLVDEEGRDVTLWNKFNDFYKLLSPIKSLISSFDTFSYTESTNNWNLEAGSEKSGNFIPSNLFLFGAVNGNSELYVRTYERIMGEYSWQRLNKLIDCFYAGNAAKNVKPLNKDILSMIMDEIERFNLLSNLKGAS